MITTLFLIGTLPFIGMNVRLFIRDYKRAQARSR